MFSGIIQSVGKITSFRETEDGRFLIELKGLLRFRRVKEIITEPEESWRFPIKDVNDFDGVEVPSPCKSFKSNISYGNFSTTSKPELIQPKPDSDLLSLFKVTSAVQWRELHASCSRRLRIRI